MDEPPKIRGTMLRAILEAMRREPAGAGFLERIDPSLVQAIDASARTAWIDGEALALICEAYEATAGVAEHVALHRRVVKETAPAPLFSPIVRGAIHLFGQGPGSLLRLYPRALHHAIRNLGQAQVRVEGRAAVVTFEQVAARFRGPFWRNSMVGVFEGILEVAGSEGEVRYDDARMSSGIVVFTATW